MLEVKGQPCVYAHLGAAIEVHVVARADGSFVIAPGYGPSYDKEVDVGGSFTADVSAKPNKPTKIGSLVIVGELVVAWAQDVGLKARSRRAGARSSAAAFVVPAGGQP